MWSLNKCARCTRVEKVKNESNGNGKQTRRIRETRQSKIYEEPEGGWKVVDWSEGRRVGSSRAWVESPVCSPSMRRGGLDIFFCGAGS